MTHTKPSLWEFARLGLASLVYAPAHDAMLSIGAIPFLPGEGGKASAVLFVFLFSYLVAAGALHLFEVWQTRRQRKVRAELASDGD